MNADGEPDEQTLKECIERVTSDYEEKISGARRRLNTALEIIVIASCRHEGRAARSSNFMSGGLCAAAG